MWNTYICLGITTQWKRIASDMIPTCVQKRAQEGGSPVHVPNMFSALQIGDEPGVAAVAELPPRRDSASGAALLPEQLGPARQTARLGAPGVS